MVNGAWSLEPGAWIRLEPEPDSLTLDSRDTLSPFQPCSTALVPLSGDLAPAVQEVEGGTWEAKGGRSDMRILKIRVDLSHTSS